MIVSEARARFTARLEWIDTGRDFRLYSGTRSCVLAVVQKTATLARELTGLIEHVYLYADQIDFGAPRVDGAGEIFTYDYMNPKGDAVAWILPDYSWRRKPAAVARWVQKEINKHQLNFDGYRPYKLRFGYYYLPESIYSLNPTRANGIYSALNRPAFRWLAALKDLREIQGDEELVDPVLGPVGLYHFPDHLCPVAPKQAAAVVVSKLGTLWRP